MGKSRSKDYSRNNLWNEYDEYEYRDVKSDLHRRREKRVRNLIRSKNVDRLLEMDDDEYDDWKDRR